MNKSMNQGESNKNKFNTIKEEDNESEEIKTEMTMYSDDDQSQGEDS